MQFNSFQFALFLSVVVATEKIVTDFGLDLKSVTNFLVKWKIPAMDPIDLIAKGKDF